MTHTDSHAIMMTTRSFPHDTCWRPCHYDDYTQLSPWHMLTTMPLCWLHAAFPMTHADDHAIMMTTHSFPHDTCWWPCHYDDYTQLSPWHMLTTMPLWWLHAAFPMTYADDHAIMMTTHSFPHDTCWWPCHYDDYTQLSPWHMLTTMPLWWLHAAFPMTHADDHAIMMTTRSFPHDISWRPCHYDDYTQLSPWHMLTTMPLWWLTQLSPWHMLTTMPLWWLHAAFPMTHADDHAIMMTTRNFPHDTCWWPCHYDDYTQLSPWYMLTTHSFPHDTCWRPCHYDDYTQLSPWYMLTTMPLWWLHTAFPMTHADDPAIMMTTRSFPHDTCWWPCHYDDYTQLRLHKL